MTERLSTFLLYHADVNHFSFVRDMSRHLASVLEEQESYTGQTCTIDCVNSREMCCLQYGIVVCGQYDPHANSVCVWVDKCLDFAHVMETVLHETMHAITVCHAEFYWASCENGFNVFFRNLIAYKQIFIHSDQTLTEFVAYAYSDKHVMRRLCEIPFHLVHLVKDIPEKMQSRVNNVYRILCDYCGGDVTCQENGLYATVFFIEQGLDKNATWLKNKCKIMKAPKLKPIKSTQTLTAYVLI